MAGERKGGFVRAALSHRDYRYLLGALAVSAAGDWLYGVALFVVVYDATGSATWVALASIARLGPYVVFGPLGGVLADRFDRRTVMLLSDLSRGLVMVVLAVAVAAGLPVLAVVLLVGLSTAVGAAFNPALSALVPVVVGEDDLAAANTVSATVESIAILVGPAVGGLLLLAGPPAMAFGINAATFFVSAGLVALVRTRTGSAVERREPGWGQRLTAGFRVVAGQRETAILVVFIVVAAFVYGLELVVWVLVSERLLGTGAEGVGFLIAAMGVGGLLGATLSSRLAASRSPGRTLMFIAFTLGLPLASLSVIRAPALAYAVLVVEGVGNIAFDVVIITLLQRMLRQDVMARAFGAVDALGVGAVLAGSLAAPLVVAAFGLPLTLAAGGALLPALALVGFPALRRIGGRSRSRMDELAPHVAVLENLRIFEGASRAVLESLAAQLREEDVEAGRVVIREGEAADDFYIVAEGALEVRSTGGATAERRVNVLHAGDYFGEIGLLERRARTATVETVTPCRLLRLSGDAFLEALGPSSAVPASLRESVVTRLARSHGPRRSELPSELS